MNETHNTQPTKRAIASRENASKGGLATAKNHSAEWLKDRAKKGGETLIQLYSADYYRFINSQRRQKKGWPLGKLRKVQPEVAASLKQAQPRISQDVYQALQSMLQTTPR